jgi:hypothetical protein
MTMGSAQNWATGDTIIITNNTGTGASAATVRNRQLIVTKVSTTTFTLADAVTGASIVGSGMSYTTTTASAQRIVVKTLPYTSVAEVSKVRVVQSGIAALLLSKGHAPWLLEIDGGAITVSKDADFKEVDGPYLDPYIGTSQTGNKTATWTTTDGLTYHLTIGSDGDVGRLFDSTDVGRAMRLWTQPVAWAAGSYASGDTVTYNGSYWRSVASSNTAVPGQPLSVAGVQTFPWVLDPTLGDWTAGYITVVTNTTHIDVLVQANYVAHTLQNASSIIDTWQIGKYTTATYPAVGGWIDGRLLLGGAVPNSVDASSPNVFDGVASYYGLFSPSDTTGGVFDDAAINVTFNDKDNNQILWFSPDRQGMIFGTEDGQWLFGAQSAGDALTPTQATVRKVSRFKSAFIEPARVGTALLFVQAFGRKVYEYMVDAFSNRFTGRLLNANAQHLPDEHGGITEIAYQEDPLPCLWACTSDGTLLGCTYRRYSDFATVPPEFNGWHQHTHGASRLFQSLAIMSVTNGQDSLVAVTYDATQTAHHIEVMSRMWGPA